MKILSYPLIACTALIFSCGNKTDQEVHLGELKTLDVVDSEVPAARQAIAKAPISDKSELNYIDHKKIIKDAHIGVQVDNYHDYRTKVDSSIHRSKGYISADNLNKSDYSINCNLSIRIPAESFETFLAFIEGGDVKLLYKNVSARDVTEEFIDIEIRLKTKREVEKRYTQLLAQARTIKDILEVEEKLRIIREEIESKEGRLNYLKNQVAYSTIHLQITQNLDYKYEPTKERNFFQRLWKSLDKGWKGFVAFLLFLVRIWPVIIIGLAIFYYIRRVRRKKHKN